ncbi:MAG: thiamine-phosphate kinase [Acidobacteriia bacterium]|nr:thiamine-phosphate kinase [Terriglobia bacterium]
MPVRAFQNESEFVRWLRRIVPARRGRLKLGIGDDAALIGVGRGQELILTTDLSIEGVHYLPTIHPPRSVGHRALARSLSDIAAMGGTPRFALISLAISRRTTRRWVEGFYAGLLDLAGRFGVAVIGGDTAIVPDRTVIDVIVCGEVPARRALLRSGARPGDHIFISGRLGLSALGLRLLRARRRPRRSAAPSPRLFAAAIRAHLYPEPQCALGSFLARRRLASAMIDVSDGLSTDLAHLCAASSVGAWIGEELLPKPQPADFGRAEQWDPTDLTLHGGEDYQLLFTVPRGRVRQVPREFQGMRLHWIGAIWVSKRVELLRPDGTHRRLEPGGWDHFRNPRD